MSAENLQFWLYDRSSVTPGYFGRKPEKSSIDKLKWMGVISSKEKEEESTLLKDIKKKSLVEKTVDIVTEPLKDIWDGFRILWSDISKLQRWELDKTEGLLWKFLQAWEARTDRIKEMNDQIDATWGSVLDKTIATWLNIFWAWVDFAWDSFVSAMKTIAPQWVEDFTAEKIQEFWNSDVWKQVMWFIEKWGWAVDNFENSSPEAWRLVNSIKSVLPLWEVLWAWAGAKILKEAWEGAIDATKKWLSDLSVLTTDSLIPWIKKSASDWTQAISKIVPVKPWNIAESIAGIDEQTKNILKSVNTDVFDEYVWAGKKAAQDIKAPTPLAIAWDKALSTLEEIKLKRAEIGKRKADILKNIEDQTIPTKEIYDDFNKFLEERFNVKIDWESLQIVEIWGKKANIGDSSIKDLQSMSDELLDLFTDDNINLWNLDATVDRIQDGINFNKLDRPGWNASKTEKQISSFLEWSINQRLKVAAWDDFIQANKDFRELIDIQNRLEKALGVEW